MNNKTFKCKFWYQYPVVPVNRHLSYYQNKHNSLNTMHPSVFYNMFQPFMSAIINGEVY